MKIINYMEEVFVITKDDIVNVFLKYNAEYLSNSDEFSDDVDDSNECAVRQAEYFIEILNELKDKVGSL